MKSLRSATKKKSYKDSNKSLPYWDVYALSQDQDPGMYVGTVRAPKLKQAQALAQKLAWDLNLYGDVRVCKSGKEFDSLSN